MRYVLGGSRSGPEGQVSGNVGLFGREAFGGGGISLRPRPRGTKVVIKTPTLHVRTLIQDIYVLA